MKKKVSNTKEKYEKENVFSDVTQAKTLTRFLAFVSDFVILIVFGVILYTIAFPITASITNLDGKEIEIRDRQSEMLQISKDAHLIPVDAEEIAQGDTYLMDVIIDTYIENKVKDESNLSDDIFYFFYFEYLPQFEINDEFYVEMNVSTFNTKILKIEEEKYSSLFTYQLDEQGQVDKSKIGVLKDEARRYLSSYLEGSQTGETLNCHDLMENLVLENYAQATYDLEHYQPQYKESYQTYLSLENEKDWIFAIPSIFAYSIASVVLYLVLPLIFKDGQTLAKKILKLGVVDRFGYRVAKYQTVIRFLVKYIIQLGVLSFMPLFIVGVFDVWSLPFISMFGWTMNFGSLLFISFLLGLMSSIITLRNKSHLDLEDLAAHTEVVILEQSNIFNSRKEKEDYLKMVEEEKLKAEGGIIHGEKKK